MIKISEKIILGNKSKKGGGQTCYITCHERRKNIFQGEKKYLSSLEKKSKN